MTTRRQDDQAEQTGSGRQRGARRSDVLPRVTSSEAGLAGSAGQQGLAQLFGAAPVPMLLIRRQDDQVVCANTKGAERLGYEATRGFLGQATELFAHRSDKADLWASLARDGHADSLEVQLRAASGEVFWALLSASVVRFDGDEAVLLGFSDLTAQKTVEHQLRFLATRDSLTQAYNRHHFWQLAHTELARVRRYDRPLALAMVDADHFKRVNDRFGHEAGDRVLKALVETCQDALRKNDVLARYGGEELIVLFPETRLEGATRVMERLRRRVAHARLRLRDGAAVRMTVSVGVAALRSREERFEALLKRADDALYLAKRAGRDRVIAA